MLRIKIVSIISAYKCNFFSDAVSVPIVLLVLEGGPGTLETVHQAIQNNTPAVIVKVHIFVHQAIQNNTPAVIVKVHILCKLKT